MEFKVVRETAAGILLAPVDHDKPVKTRCPVFLRGRKVAVITETIGRVGKPLYLAKPARGGLAGKKVSTKR
ncbi:hypothetical protein COT57_03430 [Candidatus Micrarchaeota archaeon CG09_land_8_20_14_0_10_55_25]|nr:MAG: hypothetical protein COT57_03430 [Candidatus Micrarchaeota archaeon CG09_land_8_20_14_0_10_55_25]